MSRSDGITIRPERPRRVVQFAESLIIPDGFNAGQKFRLLPFQKRLIRDIYGPHRDGLRVVRKAILSMGRKNSKSTWAAILMLAHLIGPETIRNGQLYSAASEGDQAAIIFEIAAKILRADPELEAMVRIVDSTHTIIGLQSGSVYHSLTREAGSKMGKNPSFGVYDELAQARDRRLYDALNTALGAQAEPLMLIISTQSEDPDHLLSKLIDDGITGADPTIVAHLYETPLQQPDGTETDIWDERNWKASNPALGKFRSLADMRAMAAEAKRMPGQENSFRNLNINQRVKAISPLIPRARWVVCGGDRGLDHGEAIYLGLDLSATTDLCALVAVSVADGSRVRAWFWKPQDLVDEHERRDRVPYAEWVATGLLEAVPGACINYGYVAQRLVELAHEFEVAGVAYDRYHIKFVLKELADLGAEAWIDGDAQDATTRQGLRLGPWGKGFKDMGPAVNALEQAVMRRTLQHGNNPVLTWNISNAIAVSDPAGWRKLDKSKSRFRIDGAVALAMALGLKARESAEPVVSAYEGMDAAAIKARMAL